MPCTVASTALILLAVSVSASRSLPYSLIEFSPFTPETASDTLSCRYCEKLNSTPGNLSCSEANSLAVSSSLSSLSCHCFAGLSGAEESHGEDGDQDNPPRPCQHQPAACQRAGQNRHVNAMQKPHDERLGLLDM